MTNPPSSRDQISIRDLGGAEPSVAPRHQAPEATHACIGATKGSVRIDSPTASTARANSDTRWLVHFAIIAAAAGVIAIVIYRDLFPFLSRLAQNDALREAVFRSSLLKSSRLGWFSHAKG